MTDPTPAPAFRAGEPIAADALNGLAAMARRGANTPGAPGASGPGAPTPPAPGRLCAVVARGAQAPAPLADHTYTVRAGGVDYALAWHQLVVDAQAELVEPGGGGDPLRFAPALLASAVAAGGPKWRAHGLLYTVPGVAPGEVFVFARLWGLTIHWGCEGG